MGEKKELTDWEIGQDLIAIQDTMFERIVDLPKSHPAKILVKKLAADLGDYFNENHEGKSHGFGLFSTQQNKQESEVSDG